MTPHRIPARPAALALACSLSLLAAGPRLAPSEAVATARPDVVVYVSELPKQALFEFERWKDPASPGGELAGVRNTGQELDPPPENDPHVTAKVQVEPGVPYRFWVHMKVGKPKGIAKANMVYAQFSDAVDASGRATLKPGTNSYLVLRAPSKEGWVWVGGDLAKRKLERTVTFRAREVTVRVQGGAEGVGFDQLVLSPARYLDQAPADHVVKK